VTTDLDDTDVLFDISRALESSSAPSAMLRRALTLLVDRTPIRRVSLSLVHRPTRRILADTTCGGSETAGADGRCRLGEGIVGRVIQTGESVTIDRLSEAPPSLVRREGLRVSTAEKLSCVCVPVIDRDDVVGTLHALRPRGSEASLDDDRRWLAVVASLVAGPLRRRQAAREETESPEGDEDRSGEPTRPTTNPEGLVGNSTAMLNVFEMMEQAADSDTTVLVRGESGTGKELVADGLHRKSDRSDGPFVKVNCGALPENLVESELFGHVKGAFTGADRSREGRFELADGGTIFLDEIGEVPPLLQVKLLRVLQEGALERVGGTATRRVDVRVLAATNRDLEEMLETGEFRDDLYYRLNVFPIRVPPLRERKSDLLLLACHFVDEYAEANDKEILRISTAAVDMLHGYHWPGNVRELENCIERAVLLSTDGVIHAHHLPADLRTTEATGSDYGGDLQSALDSLERELVADALEATDGNQAAAARRLGVTERVMRLRVDEYDLDPEAF